MNGQLVAASTTRQPSSLASISATASYTQHIPVLYVQSLSGMILRPVSAQFMADTFGVSVEMAAQVRALWPANTTETFPVKPGDFLVLPVSQTAPAGKYLVRGVKPYPGRHISIFVDVPATT